MRAAVAADGHAVAGADRERFYLYMSAAFVAVAVIGFAPTYWIPLVRGTLDVPPILHLHALCFYGWTLLFFRQTWLVSSGEVRRHREWGVAGVAVGTAMLFIGLAAASVSLRRAEAAGVGNAARPFSIVAVSAIVLFAALVAAAFVNVKRPDVHKRLMIVATASILQAAVGRLFLMVLAPPAVGTAISLNPPPIAVTVPPALVVDLFIVAGMIHDRKTLGRVHPTYWIAGGCVLAVQVLRVPVSATAVWIHMSGWIGALLT